MFWLLRDAENTRVALATKQQNIAAILSAEKHWVTEGNYELAKVTKKQRIIALKEQALLIDLQVRINTDQGNLAREILKHRAEAEPLVKVVNESNIPNVNPCTSQLIKLRKEQKVNKWAVFNVERAIRHLKSDRPFIKHGNSIYPRDEYPFTLETLEERLANYKADQIKWGITIVKLRDKAYLNKTHKTTYYKIIEFIKKSQNPPV